VSEADEGLLQDVINRLQTHLYGKYRGVVTDVDATTCRIKAKVPDVLGATESGWCMPCVPYAGDQVGFVFLPETGSGVWIEFEGGEVSRPIWTGCFWFAGQIPGGAGAAVKVIATKAPHKIVLDDEKGSITITDPSRNTVTLDSSGITISRAGQQIQITDSSVSVDNGALEVR
jgi:uncharacterized protein involved in type VI secretion and phage assembly